MISEGDIFLFRFPQTDLAIGKLRPALIIRQVGDVFDDCLICMISTRIKHQIPDLEMLIDPSQKRFCHYWFEEAKLAPNQSLGGDSRQKPGRKDRQSPQPSV